MINKQLVYLFLCNFAVFFIGGALLPLLPLYAGQFGATATLAGIYLAIIYLAIALGSMLAGWLAERLSPKNLFVAAGVVGVPMLILHGWVTALWQLVILTSMVWFCGGIGTALVSVFTGLYATDQRRGKTFGLMFMARPLGSVLGGLTAGQLVAWQGYPLLFVVLAAVWVGWPLVALLGVVYQSIDRPTPVAREAVTAPSRPGRPFLVLLLAALLSTVVVYFGRLGTFLSMESLNFSPQAVANAAALGALVTIPITVFIGTSSDRLGHRRLLLLCYLLAAAGALMLSGATQFWQFGLATVLLLVTNSANGSVAAALATDLLEPQQLKRRLPWLNTVTWLSGIVGFAGGGYIIDTWGTVSLYHLTTGMALAAGLLVGMLSHQGGVTLPGLPSSRMVKAVLAHKKV